MTHINVDNVTVNKNITYYKALLTKYNDAMISEIGTYSKYLTENKPIRAFKCLEFRDLLKNSPNQTREIYENEPNEKCNESLIEYVNRIEVKFYKKIKQIEAERKAHMDDNRNRFQAYLNKIRARKDLIDEEQHVMSNWFQPNFCILIKIRDKRRQLKFRMFLLVIDFYMPQNEVQRLE
jgi:hypothetical protein